MEIEEETEAQYHENPAKKSSSGGFLVACVTVFILIFMILVLVFTW